ncbi:MAG: SRPBCC family protein [Gemmatimonadota bacterium]
MSMPTAITDERVMGAPAATCFQVAADVERWPEILPHYRRVAFRRRDAFGHGLVEMAAWRDFAGPLRYPTWWVSEMTCDAREPVVRYRHVDGITTGMDVVWSFEALDADTTHVRIVHAWPGPPWPLIGGVAWRAVIAPVFVSVIAGRTLAGVAREAERRAAAESERRADGHAQP